MVSASPCRANVTDPEGRRQLCERLGAAEPRLHILVNNAGAAWGEVRGVSEAAFDKLMSVNVTAVFSLTRR